MNTEHCSFYAKVKTTNSLIFAQLGITLSLFKTNEYNKRKTTLIKIVLDLNFLKEFRIRENQLSKVFPLQV